jgi:PD-(D/E)XK nuclease superfamily domain
MFAHQTGRTAEDAIADLLRRHNCEFRRQAKIGRSIYRPHVLHADFLVDNILEFPDGLAIESKWQDIAGTADEKFPYLVANVMAGSYRCPVLVVVHGGGVRPGALQWLKAQVDGKRLVAVFSFEELLSWVQRRIHVQVTRPKFNWRM